MRYQQIETLLRGATTTVTTPSTSRKYGFDFNYAAQLQGTGAVSATVIIEVSFDEINWYTWGTLSPTGTTTATDTLPSARGVYPYHRVRVTNISASSSVTVVGGGA